MAFMRSQNIICETLYEGARKSRDLKNRFLILISPCTRLNPPRLSNLVHQLENSLFSFDRMSLGPLERNAVQEGLKGVDNLLDYYIMIHDDKLKRAAFADFEAVMVRLASLVAEHKDQMSQSLQREFAEILGRMDEGRSPARSAASDRFFQLSKNRLRSSRFK